MIQVAKSKILFFSLLLLVLCTFFLGCSRQAKHNVLSFFFTGVPPIDETKKGEEGAKKSEHKRQKEVVPRKQRKRKVSPVFVHGPRASGRCALCHDTSSSAVFKGRRNESRSKQSSFSGGIPGRLAMPLDKLCVSCHEGKSLEQAKGAGLSLHAPAASGECTLCHDPHQARGRYMMRVTGRELCLQCHEEEDLRSVKVHRGKGECLKCHNAHLGKNRMMLVKDYEETF